jgi:ParB family chromosome partitioning protein
MLVGQPNAEELAEQIVRLDLNVRQVEAMARKSGRQQAREVKRTGRMKDADTEALEQRLTDALGLLVTIEHRDNGSGTLSVRYRTLEQLDEVVRRLESAATDARRGEGGPRIRRL